jgi:DNA mismatch repair protein MutL
VRSAVKQALGAHNVVPTLDFSFDVNFAENWKNDELKKEEVSRENSYKTFSSPNFKKQDVSGWEKLFETTASPVDLDRPALNQRDEDTELLTFSSKANNSDRKEPAAASTEYEDTGVTFQVGMAFVVAQMSFGMLVLDQQASHERILYERFRQQLQNSSGASQQCLFPQSIDLSPSDFALVMDLKEELTNLGFLVGEFGKNAVVINGIPADITITNEKALFEALLEQFKHFKSELSLDKKENLARSLAKKSSLKKGTRLNNREMETLVGQLFACQNPNYGLSGNKTFIKLDMNKILTFFSQ